jgi:hypothetical protein
MILQMMDNPKAEPVDEQVPHDRYGPDDVPAASARKSRREDFANSA